MRNPKKNPVLMTKVGFKNQAQKTALASVFGQLSDGLWENSHQKEKFWRYMTYDMDNDQIVQFEYWGGRSLESNGEFGLSKTGIKTANEWLAERLKDVVKAELNYGGQKNYAKFWKEGKEQKLHYLSAGEVVVTVKDAREAFEILMSIK